MGVSKIKKDRIKTIAGDISCGLLATVIDLSLFIMSDLSYMLEESFKSPYYKVIEKSTERAVEDLITLGINKETVKRAIWKATHKKWIKRGGENQKFLSVTPAGIDKLKGLLPNYQEKRPWDSHLYLVTYDVPEEAKSQREILRECLKKLGCGLLQDSVWLTPYNPRAVLKRLISQYGLSGLVIVSDVGKEGSVGDEDLDDLVARIFHLDKLNDRYEDFIQKLKEKKLTKFQASFEFMSILNDDPQLPFEILPYNWQGDKAYQYLKEYNPS